MTTPVAGIDHVAIIVRDIESSLQWYVEKLGLTVIGDEVNAAAGVRLVYLDAGNTMLQLVCPVAPGPLADALAKQGEGLHHLCFQVENIDETIDSLAPGAVVPVTVGGRQRRTAFLPQRPNNLVLELSESDPFDAAAGCVQYEEATRGAE